MPLVIGLWGFRRMVFVIFGLLGLQFLSIAIFRQTRP